MCYDEWVDTYMYIVLGNFAVSTRPLAKNWLSILYKWFWKVEKRCSSKIYNLIIKHNKIATRKCRTYRTIFLWVKFISILFFVLSSCYQHWKKCSLWHQKEIPQFISCRNMLSKSTRIFLQKDKFINIFSKQFLFHNKEKRYL